ncbi:CbiX/SirB N-terminal domain-containing protein [Actinomycetes bacterium KLBMP 9797]
MTPIVLVVHGSRDPRAARATRALVRAVAAARPGVDVRASYLDHTLPRPGQVLAALAADGHDRVTLVPLLLTAAYHGRVDVPDAVRAARATLPLDVAVTDVLGPVGDEVPELLIAGLTRRLATACAQAGLAPAARRSAPGVAAGWTGSGSGVAAGWAGSASGGAAAWAGSPSNVAAGSAGSAFDAVVVAAAGTRDAAARETVVRAADALGAALGVPTTVAYASAAPPTGAEAVAELRARGARRIAVAGYFLAPGQLYDTVTSSARAAGAIAVAEPLEDAWEIAHLVLSRANTAPTTPQTAAA